LLNKIRTLLHIKKDDTPLEITTVESNNSIINLDIVEQLKKYGGEEMVISVFTDFENETTEQIDSCFVSVEDGNYENILINLHTLKGNAGTLGIDKVSQLTVEIESKLKLKKKIYSLLS